jgi:hypothetical protein
VSGLAIFAIREAVHSEGCDALALRFPLGRKLVAQAPVGRQPQRLRTIRNVADKVRCQERQSDEFLNPPFGCTGTRDDSLITLTVFQLPMPLIGKCDILDEHLIDISSTVANNVFISTPL